MDELEAYTPPWEGLVAPAKRVRLAHLPTPLHRWRLDVPCEVWVKRDDMTGSEAGGNKLRKLEFLLADAMETGCDTMVTTGAVQSNHCRATAVSCRRVGLTPHLVLRGEKPSGEPGGNLLVDHLAGAEMRYVPAETFAAKGQPAVLAEVGEDLRAQGRTPYLVPSGGSNAVGLWGYVDAASELQGQLKAKELQVDRIYCCCGSCGTLAGLALFAAREMPGVEVVGIGVDNDPDFFYDKIDGLYREIGAPEKAREACTLVDAKNVGYGVASSEELAYLRTVATTTGVVLDPVYTVKAALGMVRDLTARPCSRAIFIHTGGLLGTVAYSGLLESG